MAHFHAMNKNEAWALANRLFKTDYAVDAKASEQAGYDIYMSTLAGSNEHITDLGDRLELNLDNETINIWINDKVMLDAETIGDINSALCELRSLADLLRIENANRLTALDYEEVDRFDQITREVRSYMETATMANELINKIYEEGRKINE